MLLRLLVLTSIVWGVACDDDGKAASKEVDERCAPIIDQCMERQRSCVIQDDEPTCAACPVGQFPAHPTGRCEDIPGTALKHDFGIQTMPGAYEIGSLCQSWVLGNDEELWVNAVEMDNDGFYHHSNWFFVPEAYRDWPTDSWPNCYDEGFDEVTAALAGGVLYAQSTQVKVELQKFVPGAAVHIPAHSRIITVTHLLNYTPSEQKTGLRLTLHTLPKAEVTIPLTPAQLVYHDLEIPPESDSWFGATCDIGAKFQQLTGHPMDAKLHYVLPHYHALGAGFELYIVGGPRDGEKIVDLGPYGGDPFGFAFDPPIDLTGATGLRWGCKFTNPTSEEVNWGIGNQEMCEGLLFWESPIAFSAGTSETTVRDTVSGLPTFSGECNVAAFPFDPNK